MRVTTVAMAGLVLSGVARAGVGTTVPLQDDVVGALLEFSQSFDGQGSIDLSQGFRYPSLDIRINEVVIQIHAIETLVIIANDEVYLGGNAWVTPMVAPLGTWEIFAGIGGSLDLLTFGDELGFAIGPVAPIGVRFGQEARLALYAMPGIGLAAAAGETDLVGEGAVVASVWF